LIRILSSSRELGLEIRSFNSIRIDDQVQVTVNVVVCRLCLLPFFYQLNSYILWAMTNSSHCFQKSDRKLRMQIFVQFFTLSSEQITRYWFTPHCWELMK
jgi:hypothetical protein